MMDRRDFCLWLVPSRDGKVRKLRFGWKTLLIAFALTVVFAGSLTFVASDYARVQALRLKNYLLVKQLSSEKQELMAVHKSLKSEVVDLKSLSAKAISYEKQVKDRVQELNSVLQSVGVLGYFEKPEADEGPQVKSEGDIGGAEIECQNGTDCGEYVFSPSSAKNPDLKASFGKGFIPTSSPGFGLGEDLVEELDHYINILKVVPVGWPASGYVTSGFGRRVSPFSGRLSMHEGVDLSLAQGSLIISTADGIVREVGRRDAYGLVVEIAHTERIVTRYAHLFKTFVKPGERVCRGEIIGLVGSSGRSTGPHLHYEVVIDQHAKNPMKYIELAGKLDKIFG